MSSLASKLIKSSSSSVAGGSGGSAGGGGAGGHEDKKPSKGCLQHVKPCIYRSTRYKGQEMACSKHQYVNISM